jgi:serine/threonine-protein kinase
VIDFGVAKAHGTEGRTEAGQVRGKSAYMSPEQALARPIDRRSDIFSLGIVLFEMVTMRRLFQRENPLLVYRAVCEEPIPSMTDARSGVPKQLARIGSRALERSPDARYATTQEMRYELAAFVRKMTSAEPEEIIAAMMRDLFADRMAQKDALRRGIEHGSKLEALPEAETDLGATIPSVALGESAIRELLGDTRRRSRMVAIAAGAAVTVTGVLLLARGAPEGDPVGASEPATERALEERVSPASNAMKVPEARPVQEGAPLGPKDDALSPPLMPAPSAAPATVKRARPLAPSATPEPTASAEAAPPAPSASPVEAPGFRRFD